MTSPIHYPAILQGHTVDLIALTIEHYPLLKTLAADKRIWEFYSYDGSKPDTFLNLMTTALIEKDKGTQWPFVIFHKQHNKIIGSTRLLDIQPKHKKLEIGATWLLPDYWATEVNPECKLLLLTYCFEVLHTARVQLKTGDNNIRSRKAIEKIGGRFEGTFRHDMIREDGTTRDSAYYSIINNEWPEKKAALQQLYNSRCIPKNNLF